MSAFTHDRPSRIIPLGTNMDPMEPLANASQAGGRDPFDGFVQAARGLQSQLNAERARSRQLTDDLRNAHASYERMIQEAQAKARELSVKESSLRMALDEHRRREKTIVSQAQTTIERGKKTQDALKRYQSAWVKVQAREREAKEYIIEGQKNARRMAELERRFKQAHAVVTREKQLRQQAERHASGYQTELQNVLIRLHSAESRFNELSKEYQVLHQTKRSFDQEIEKVELSMRERFQWELMKDREKIRAELEKEAALDRESFREELRMQRDREREAIRAECRTEVQKEVEFLRASRDQALEQLQSAQSLAEQSVVKAKIEADDAVMQAHTDAQRVVTLLRDELEISKSQVEDAQSRIVRLESDHRELQKKEASLFGKLTESRARIMVLEKERDGLRNELDQLCTEAQREIEEARAGGREIEVRIQGMNRALVDARNDAVALRAQLTELSQEPVQKSHRTSTDLETKIEVSQLELRNSLERETQLQDTLNALESAFSDEFERSRSLESSLLEIRFQFDNALGEVRSELDALRTDFQMNGRKPVESSDFRDDDGSDDWQLRLDDQALKIDGMQEFRTITILPSNGVFPNPREC